MSSYVVVFFFLSSGTLTLLNQADAVFICLFGRFCSYVALCLSLFHLTKNDENKANKYRFRQGFLTFFFYIQSSFFKFLLDFRKFYLFVNISMTLKSYIILSRHSKTSITNMFFSSKLAQRHLQPLICQNALNIIIFVKTFITRCFSLSKHVQYLSSFKSKRPLPYYLFKTHTHTHKNSKGHHLLHQNSSPKISIHSPYDHTLNNN